jgi:two-component system, LuxR family, sensor kinase FixL
MSPLEAFHAFSDTHRNRVFQLAALLSLAIAFTDWKIVPNISMGFLYIVPMLLVAGSLRSWQILVLAVTYSTLREAFNFPFNWQPGSAARILVGSGGFALAGLFVSEIVQKRRLMTQHVAEQEVQIKLRREAERQIRVLIETSPLAILTANQDKKVVLANQSAHQLLGFENETLPGTDIRPFLPIVERLLGGQEGNLRTTVESKGQRRNGEVFLAHMWVSTYSTETGTALAAVVWDASENLRDREGAGLDSMMATSRILIGAVSHEVRNLAAAAASAHEKLAAHTESGGSEQHRALGAIIKGMEKIASSGLRMATRTSAAVADLGTVLDEARIVIEPRIKEAGGAISWRIARGLPLVQADHHSLLQVFLNLARNSERAIQNADEKQITVEACLERDLVIVRFRDTGPGVQNIDQLFRPFQPGAESGGLGLYISRAILRSDGGDLRHEPIQQGACFAVELWPVEDRATNA